MDFETSPWAILEGSGLHSPSPKPRFGKVLKLDGADVVSVQLQLLLTGGSADAIQTQVRNVERILEYADEQQRGRRGYPESFVGELNCYLDMSPSGLMAGGQRPVVGGVLELDSSWYSHTWWQQNYVKAILTLECRREIYGAEVVGAKGSTAITAQPFSIAATDTGGNSGIAPAPMRLGIHCTGGAIKNLYGAIYPNLGTLIAPILNSGSAGADAALMNTDYNRGAVSGTGYVACGTVSWTTDGKPKRYLVIIKRRCADTTALNWTLKSAGGISLSGVWADNAPPANTWAGFVAGMLIYPNLGLTGTTGGAAGTPNTFSNTVQVMASRQSGTASVNVDTDFVAFIPMDAGSYFAVKDNASVFGAGVTDWLHIYNEDGILRANIADGPPGGTVTAIAAGGVTPSGRPLPTLWTGDNKVVIVGLDANGLITHTFGPDLQWTIRPRSRSL